MAVRLMQRWMGSGFLLLQSIFYFDIRIFPCNTGHNDTRPTSSAEGRLIVPTLVGLRHIAYVHKGDLNIGHLVTVRADPNGGCQAEVSASGVLRAEAMKYAVERINNDPDLLPNITLGFVAYDDCGDEIRALKVAVYLVGDPSVDGNSSSSCSCSDNGTSTAFADRCNAAATAVTDDVDSAGNDASTEELQPHDVVGVLGTINSMQATAVAQFFGVFELPLMSLYATSDVLSDKSRYEYFMRLVPPDVRQAQTLLNVVGRLGWTYINLVYTDSSYGKNAAGDVESLLRTPDPVYAGVCLADSLKIPSDATKTNFENIVRVLVDNDAARVILTFISSYQQGDFFDAVRRLAGVGRLFFLSGDAVNGAASQPFMDVLVGGIYTDLPNNPVPGFVDYVDARTPMANVADDDVWFVELWENVFNCSFDDDGTTTSNTSCADSSPASSTTMTMTLGSMKVFDDDWEVPHTSRIYDGTYVYAHALHALIAERCPSAFVDRRLLNGCFAGPDLLRQLKRTSLDATIGRIEFDDNGNMVGDVVIWQFQRSGSSAATATATANGNAGTTYASVNIGRWSSATNVIDLSPELIDWSMFRPAGVAVESVCSRPCRAGEYVIWQAVACCWRCQPCRSDEIVISNATACAACPSLTWPDADATGCRPIAPTYLRLGDPISTALLGLAAVGAATSVAVVAVYVVRGDHRLVRATNRGLSLTILVGTLVAYVSVVGFVAAPTDGVCLTRGVGFHVGINLLYAPLLVKNVQIFRIFDGGKSSVKLPLFVGRKAQIAMTAAAVVAQVCPFVRLRRSRPAMFKISNSDVLL